MKSMLVWICLLVSFLRMSGTTFATEAPVFSGPQIGEPIPDLKLVGVFDEHEGKPIEFAARLEDKEGPDASLVVFFHQRTRPAFGLTNAIVRFAESRKNLRSAVVFLSDDTTETTQWLGRVRQHLPGKETVIGVSPDGQAGPGAFGLNRNVTLTVLVAEAGKVTANFALVQPSAQADGPSILKAIVDATGGGEVPTIDSYIGRAGMQRRAGRATEPDNDPQLTGLLRTFINVDSDERVKEVAREIEAYVALNSAARKQLGQVCGRVAGSGKLENYGIPSAQSQIQAWAKKFGKPNDENDLEQSESNAAPQETSLEDQPAIEDER